LEANIKSEAEAVALVKQQHTSALNKALAKAEQEKQALLKAQEV
jgi:hypothetical protein